MSDFKKAIANGLTGFTLYPTKNAAWQASAQFSGMKGFFIHIHPDVDEVIRMALSDNGSDLV